jgi:hypothetical protein
MDVKKAILEVRKFEVRVLEKCIALMTRRDKDNFVNRGYDPQNSENYGK